MVYTCPTTTHIFLCKRIQKKKITDSVMKDNAYFDLPVFFHTPIVDEAVVLVMEVIVGVKERNVLMKEFSIGWTILRLFKELDYGKNLEQMPQLKTFINKKGKIVLDDSLKTTQFFTGTPRYLLLLKEPIENNLIPRLGCRAFCSLMRHNSLNKAIHLFEHNDLLCKQDHVPGLAQEPSSQEGRQLTNFQRPELLPITAIELSQMEIILPTSFEAMLLQQMEENRKKEQAQQYDIDRQCIIEKRVMIAGAHNGCTFLRVWNPLRIFLSFEFYSTYEYIV